MFEMTDGKGIEDRRYVAERERNIIQTSRKGRNKDKIYDHDKGPNVSPGATSLKGVPMASAVFIHTYIQEMSQLHEI
jgi:hypothetical protein